MEQLDLRLYAIVDPENTGGHDLVDLARAVAAGGATLVELRDKGNDDPRVIEEPPAPKAALAPFGVPLIVNDRGDGAPAARPHGGHGAQEDIPLAQGGPARGPAPFIDPR